MHIRFHWGIGIAIVYSAFALATAGFVLFAMEHPAELVSSDYYRRSLTHDQRIAAARRAEALGGRVSCTATGDGRNLVVTVPHDDTPVAGTITLYRPSDARADRVFTLAPDRAGTQLVSLSGLAKGRWILQLQWQAHGLAYYHEEPVTLP